MTFSNDPRQVAQSLADLWPSLVDEPPTPQDYALAMQRQAGGLASPSSGPVPAAGVDGDMPMHLLAAQVLGAYNAAHADGSSGPNTGNPSNAPGASALTPGLDGAPNEGPRPDAVPALPLGQAGTLSASVAAVPAAARVAVNGMAPSGHEPPLKPSPNPAGRSTRLSPGPDPIVWATNQANPKLIPPGYVVDPRTGAVSRWQSNPRVDLLHPATSMLQPLNPEDKQRLLESITGARAEGVSGWESPGERFQRSALESGSMPGVQDWAKLRAPSPEEQKVLDFIARKEGIDDDAAFRHHFASPYDVSYRYTPSSKPLTQMSLGDLERYQRELIRIAGSSAVGRYQFTKDTLDTLKKSLHLKEDDLFTPELQDRLGLEQLRLKGLDRFRSSEITAQQFQDGLSQTWDSLPRFGTGRSWYKHAPKATDQEVQSVIGKLVTPRTSSIDPGY